MKSSLTQFNQLPESVVSQTLFACCGSTLWVENMRTRMPFTDERKLFDCARQIWYEVCGEADYLEAFGHHPRIGDREQLRQRFAATADWAATEQAGTKTASEAVLDELAAENENYFKQNGYIFLICATGKPASEMLALLKERLKHDREEEIQLAKGEQFKITLLRLQKVLELRAPFWNEVSQITTHVLDTSVGNPGAGIVIRLKQKSAKKFQAIGIGITNSDGRVANLLPAGLRLPPGHYQMCFDTNAYFEARAVVGFYPKVDIDFMVFDETHYHVPLLINPFGFSTYRGS